MRLRRPSPLLAVALLLAACAGVSVNQDYDPTADFAAYRTFDWPGCAALVDRMLDSYPNPGREEC